jgi:hypothetical protein
VPDKVRAKISTAYVSGLKSCYRRVLCERGPEAQGTVTLQFDVTESGRTEHAKVTAFDDTLSACMQARAMSWRFDAPKDRDGTATTATFAVNLKLTPE